MLRNLLRVINWKVTILELKPRKAAMTALVLNFSKVKKKTKKNPPIPVTESKENFIILIDQAFICEIMSVCYKLCSLIEADM